MPIPNNIREDILMARWGRKSAVVDHWARQLDLTPETLRRQLRREFGPSAKRLSNNRAIPDELIRAIAKVKMEGVLLTKGSSRLDREISTETAIDILRERNFPGVELLYEINYQTGEIRYKTSTVNRRLKQLGFHDAEPRRRREAKRVNHVWLLDFSRSKYFQVVDIEPGGRWILRVAARPLPNKATAGKRLWAVTVVDDASRASDTRYYVAAGESWVIGLDMLRRMWMRPADDPHPMRYLPKALKCDNGAFRKRAEVRDLMQRLDIDLPGVTPGNADAQGKVEARWRAIWRQFELKLAIQLGQGTTIFLDELNDLLADYILQSLDKPHPLIQGISIKQYYYQDIQMTIQRTCPIDPTDHAYRIKERTVDGCCLFSWNGLKYQAPAWAQHQRVRVWASLSGDVYVESLDRYHPPVKAIPPKKGETYPYIEYGSFDGTPRHTWRQQIESEVRRDHRILPREESVIPDSPASTSQETIQAFANVDLARQWIGLQISIMTGGEWGYEDFKEEFDGLLAETLDRETIAAKLNILREAIRRQTMALFKKEGL